MKNKTIKKIEKKGKKIIKKAKNDPLAKEYFQKQKKLTKETLRKFAKSTAKKIDQMLE